MGGEGSDLGLGSGGSGGAGIDLGRPREDMAGPSLPLELCKDDNDLDKIVLREPRGCSTEPPPSTDVPNFTSAVALPPPFSSDATTAAAPPQSSDLDATSDAAPPLPTQSIISFPRTTDVPDFTSAAALPCAACRFRHQKCKDDCLLAPFFPESEDSKFQKVRSLFEVSTIQETLESLLPHERPISVATMIYESEVRAARPDTGCIGIILELHNQIERKAAHLALLRQYPAVVASPTIGAGDDGVSDTNLPVFASPTPSSDLLEEDVEAEEISQ